VLLGTAMLAAAVLIVLFGLFAILYRGDAGADGDPYMKINGSEVDGDLVGVIALLISALAVVLSIILLKQLALIGFGVLALSLGLLSGTLGIWLFATPDPDGGRQAVGGMLTVFAAGMALVAGALFRAFRRRGRIQRTA
jgi:hypothetical protein